MEIPFYKFDGAGNDFVVVDNRRGIYTLDETTIAAICHRRFGVGADGLMTLESAADGYDFEMLYYNSDGRIGSMCGNGGRCIAAFAYSLGLGSRLHFIGYDGPHDAEILDWNGHQGTVRLRMRDVGKNEIVKIVDGIYLNTGSPHYVQRVDNLDSYDVVGEGRRLRNRADLFPKGTNVDFIEDLPDGKLALRTYERGVEDETLACGTGVTACAIVTGKHNLVARGGQFTVDYCENATGYTDVWLTGPVSLNFTGCWPLNA